MSDILDLTLEEIIAEKIKRQENIISQAKKEIAKLNTQLKQITNPTEEKIINTFHHVVGKNSFSELGKNLAITHNLLNHDSKNTFSFPSQREMREKIFSLLNSSKTPIKTSQMIDYYYSKMDLDNDTRLDLTRRFSVTLNQLTKKHEVYSEKVRGEKGFFYTTHKELIGRTG